MLQVMAAIIRKNERILICQRGEGGNCANLWEFPGGKLEEGENPEDCLVRECEEELGVKITVLSKFTQTRYRYPDTEIRFTFYDAVIHLGEVRPVVHQNIRWVRVDELKKYTFCPADIEVVQKLQAEYF